MATLTYATHRHNPRLTTVGFLFAFLAILALTLRVFGIGGRLTFAVGLGAMIATDIVLLLISRRYTTRLQDRIIRLEMKLRGAEILSADQQAALMRLPMRQLVALRFASDQDVPVLLERALREKLSPDQIKRAITTWVPDPYPT